MRQRQDSKLMVRSSLWSFLPCLALMLVFAANVHGQTQPVTSEMDAPAAHQKPLTFDVVSIRPSSNGDVPGVRILPDGYQAKVMSLETTILIAYFPTPFFKHGNELKGLPSWAANETYDIDAKVSPSDMAEWQRLNPSLMRTSELLQQMLRAVLIERCKLAIHSMSAQVDGYALTADESKLKLEEQSDSAPVTQGMKLLDGGMAVGSKDNDGKPLWTFSNTSMAALIGFLQISAKGPLEDKTGLQGKYHFALTSWRPEPPSGGTDELARDPGPPVPWDLDRVGLKVSRVKVPSTAWIVDNIQRPSSN